MGGNKLTWMISFSGTQHQFTRPDYIEEKRKKPKIELACLHFKFE